MILSASLILSVEPDSSRLALVIDQPGDAVGVLVQLRVVFLDGRGNVVLHCLALREDSPDTVALLHDRELDGVLDVLPLLGGEVRHCC